MPQPNDLTDPLRRLRAGPDAGCSYRDEPVELARGGVVPGVARQPMKKLGSDKEALFQLLRAGRRSLSSWATIKRLLRGLRGGTRRFLAGTLASGTRIETYVIHPEASVFPASTDGQRLTGSIPNCSSVRSLDGCGASGATAAWLAIPTIQEEDARRPNREREKLVGDRTRIINRIKATLIRFGIRTFKPTLRKAEERLKELRTAEGRPLLENTRAELRRDIARLRMIQEQIKEIEQRRLRDRTSFLCQAGPACDGSPDRARRRHRRRDGGHVGP